MNSSLGQFASVLVPRRPLSLRTNFKWTLAGNLVYTASQAGVVLVLGRWGGPELLGRFTLALAIATPIVILAMLHLQQVQVTDARNEYAFEHYFATRLFTSLLAFIVIAVCALLGPYKGQAAWVILWVGLAKCIDAVSDIVRALFQRHERMNLSAISLMLKGPAEVGLLTAVYFWTGNLIYCAAAIAGGWLLVLLCYDLPLGRALLGQVERASGIPQRVSPSFNWRVILNLSRRALPAGIGVFVFTLTQNVPRYFLERYHGEAELGYYGVLDYVVAAAMLVVAALGQSASPRLAHAFVESPAHFCRLLWKLIGLAVAMGTAFVGSVIVVGKPALALALRPDYGEYHLEFILLALAGAVGFTLFFTGVAVMAARNFHLLMVAAVLSLLTILAACSILVPRHGVWGAVLALLASRLVVLACHAAGLIWLVGQRQREWAKADSQGLQPTASRADR